MAVSSLAGVPTDPHMARAYLECLRLACGVYGPWRVSGIPRPALWCCQGSRPARRAPPSAWSPLPLADVLGLGTSPGRPSEGWGTAAVPRRGGIGVLACFCASEAGHRLGRSSARPWQYLERLFQSPALRARRAQGAASLRAPAAEALPGTVGISPSFIEL